MEYYEAVKAVVDQTQSRLNDTLIDMHTPVCKDKVFVPPCNMVHGMMGIPKDTRLYMDDDRRIISQLIYTDGVERFKRRMRHLLDYVKWMEVQPSDRAKEFALEAIDYAFADQMPDSLIPGIPIMVDMYVRWLYAHIIYGLLFHDIPVVNYDSLFVPELTQLLDKPFKPSQQVLRLTLGMISTQRVTSGNLNNNGWHYIANYKDTASVSQDTGDSENKSHRDPRQTQPSLAGDTAQTVEIEEVVLDFDTNATPKKKKKKSKKAKKKQKDDTAN